MKIMKPIGNLFGAARLLALMAGVPAMAPAVASTGARKVTARPTLSFVFGIGADPVSFKCVARRLQKNDMCE